MKDTIVKGLIRKESSFLLLYWEQMKQFPNPLLIFLTDDFVTRTIVGVTLPLDARNCLGRETFRRTSRMVVATFAEWRNWFKYTVPMTF